MRAEWNTIPKDKYGFFDEDSDLYEQLPIIIVEMFEDNSTNFYYIDEENWHDTLADLSRQRFKYYIKVEELMEDKQ